MSDAATRLNAALEGRYRIERRLGEGATAVVYLATDLRHDRKVALKVLKPDLAAAVGAERFLTEIKTTARLQHPRILPLYDSGSVDSFVFYVMPYVSGETLRERLDRERQLPVEDAVRIAAQVTEALDHAHGQGVVHRDVKPANVLLLDGDALVADFGIALAVGQDTERLTQTGLSVGTPQYMSPEQATGDAATGAATDVWALACVLYEMLAGEPPFAGTTPQGILGTIVAGSAPPLSEKRRATPPNISAAVAKALEKVPADRFRTAGEFARALSDPDFRYGSAPKGVGRATVTTAAVGSFLLGVLAWALLAPADRPDGLGAVRFVIPNVSATGVGRSVALSPDGSLIATGTAGTPVTVRRVADFEQVDELAPSSAYQPFFSPDGDWVGYFDGVAATLMRRRVAGGTPSVIASGSGARALGASWGEDGSIVFATTEGLYRVSAAGGTVELLMAPDPERGELYYAWPLVLPGSRAVLFTVVPEASETDGDASIASLDLQTREVNIVLPGGSSPRYSATGHLLYSAGATLHAVAFDPVSRTTRGEPVELPIRDLSLTRALGADFDVSKSGTLAYMLEASGAGELVWVDRDGREDRRSLPPRGYIYPRISRDGNRIVGDAASVSSARDLYVWDMALGTSLRLTNEPREEFFAEWSTGGDSVYFTSNQGGGAFNIYRRAADGTGAAELIFASDSSSKMLNDLSPDGRRIVVAETRTGTDGFDLVTLVLDESVRLDTLLSTPNREYNAVVSPDGRWVAYQSDASGQYEVYVVPIDRAARERTKVSIDGGEKPLWSASGDTVFYRSPKDSMMAVSVTRGATLGVRSVTPLFPIGPQARFGVVSGRGWDISPRDGRFLFSRRAPSRPGGVHLVLNWTQELQRAMEN